jgi:anti-sigma regulatory factor (Ser/Thr protein kinase)
LSLIGVLNSDDGLTSQIRASLETDGAEHHLLRFFSEEARITEFLNFDLPEIIILNLTDPLLKTPGIVSALRGESWMHNFGIICIYDRGIREEEELLPELKELNVLTVLEKNRIPTHLHNIIHIIEENWQIIFQQDITEKLVKRSAGAFLIDNDPLTVQVYAGLAVTNLLQRGVISVDQSLQLQLALSELIQNGIEHGHCGIGMEEKENFLLSGGSIVELIQQKCTDPQVAARRVRFEWDSGADSTVFTVRDQGEGFDVRKLQTRLKNGGPETVNGRGIMMARRIAKRLSFNRKGNVVRLEFSHSPDTERLTPGGFSDQEMVTVSPGDTIFEEGESSDYLFYIASGHFGVFHARRKVGNLSPSDIFMGEMSFLLNNIRSATVRAESRGKLIKISRKAFVSVVKEYPHYGIFLSKLIARKLARANSRKIAAEAKQNDLRP